MSNLYTNLPNLSLGANGSDGATFTSSAISVGAITCTSITNTGPEVVSTYLATKVAGVTAAATITALSSAKSFVRINATIAVSLRGITAGVDGQLLDVYFKAGTHALTITPQATAAATAARILLMSTSATAVTTGSGFASFIYSADDSRWLLKYLTT